MQLGKHLAPYCDSCVETHGHTARCADVEYLRLSDFASVLTKCTEKCAVNYIVKRSLGRTK
jgi:hypothetical protein